MLSKHVCSSIEKIKLSRETGSTAANKQRYWLIRYTLPACRINKLPAHTCHRCRCSRWENNSCCWFVWKFKAHILDCTILQLGLHILLFGLHKIGWTAPLEYALAPTTEKNAFLMLNTQHYDAQHRL